MKLKFIFRLVLLIIAFAIASLLVFLLVKNFTTGFQASAEEPAPAIEYDVPGAKMELPFLEGMTVVYNGPGVCGLLPYGETQANVRFDDYYQGQAFLMTIGGEEFPVFPVISATTLSSWTTSYNGFIPGGSASNGYSGNFWTLPSGTGLGSTGSSTYAWQPNDGYVIWLNSGQDPVEAPQPIISQCYVEVVKQTAPYFLRVDMYFTIIDDANYFRQGMRWDMGTLTVSLRYDPTTGGGLAALFVPGVYSNESGTTILPNGPASRTFVNVDAPNEEKASNAFRQGREEGYQSGLAIGKDIGREEGFSEGYDAGQEAGYNAGYQEGLSVGSGASIGSSLNSASAIVRTVWQIVNVPILGPYFTLGTLLSIVVIFSLVLFIIRIVRG